MIQSEEGRENAKHGKSGDCKGKQIISWVKARGEGSIKGVGGFLTGGKKGKTEGSNERNVIGVRV